MIGVQSLSLAVYDAISTNPTLINSQYDFEYGAIINTNPEQAPWVGVWAGNVDIETRFIAKGLPASWRGTVDINVFQQYASWQGSGDTMAGLFAGQDVITTIVGSDITMKGTALQLQRISSQLYHVDETQESLFLTNLIVLRYMVNG